MNPVLENIFSRKSVRNYNGKPVSQADMNILIRAGMAAPCSRDKRCWFFIVVNDPAVIARLSEGLPYSKMILSSQHAIVVFADMNFAHGGAETPYWIQDCSATVENILLAAESMGLGACWTGVHPREERVGFVKGTLGAPDHVIPLCVIAIGHPTGEDKVRDKYDSSRIFWNHWGER